MDAESWDRLFAEKELLFPVEPIPMIVELVSTLKPGRVLELGAGEGRHAVWLAEQGWQVTAVDFSRVALDRAAGRARERGVEIECVLADAADVRPTPGRFDLVLIAYMHPEPRDRDAAFAAAAEAVAPGGHLLVAGVDLADPRAASRHPRPAHAHEAGDWRFTPGMLAGAFPGIELARCERVTRAPETDEGSDPRIDTLAWGHRPPAPGPGS